MNQQLSNNPLLSRYDRDPGRYRPYKYGCLIDVPVDADGSGEGMIRIMNQPFIMDRISHYIIGPTWDPYASGLAQDGQYYIEWKEEYSEYQNQPLIAAIAYGTVEFPLYLSSPIGFPGDKTLNFKVTNAYQRILTPVATTFKVQIVLHGVADWGKV